MQSEAGLTRLRNLAIRLLTEKLPADEHSDWLREEVCQGRLHSRGHTPSPELPNWLLWKMGCRDSRILSRDIPELNISWHPEALQKISSGARRVSSWVQWEFDTQPEPGDILHLGRPSWGEVEHVCVFINGNQNEWTTADMLPCERKGSIEAKIVTRKVKGVTIVGYSGVQKHINGWISIGRLALDSAPESTP